MPRHVCKGDSVIVTAGNDKGVTGEVLRVLTKQDRVVVQGVNMRTKHVKPTQQSPQGGILKKEMPIHISNVALVGADGRPTRAGYALASNGDKTRVDRRSGEAIS